MNWDDLVRLKQDRKGHKGTEKGTRRRRLVRTHHQDNRIHCSSIVCEALYKKSSCTIKNNQFNAGLTAQIHTINPLGFLQLHRRWTEAQHRGNSMQETHFISFENFQSRELVKSLAILSHCGGYTHKHTQAAKNWRSVRDLAIFICD